MTDLKQLRQALLRLDGQACALDHARSSALLGIVSDLVTGNDVSDARLGALGMFAESHRSRPTYIPTTGKDGTLTAIVSVVGVALYDLEFQPYCFSTRLLAKTMSELTDDKSVSRIVLRINTPGGAVTGTPEAADAIYMARSKKPVFAIVDPLCASAGYWLASQCSKIVAVPSADIGSIGVFMMHVDVSAALEKAGVKPTIIRAGQYKAEGNPYEPLSEHTKTFYQAEIDSNYRDFLSAVARGRNTSAPAVKLHFGGGRCLSAKDALTARMIDAIERPDLAMNSISFGRYSMIEATQSPSAESRRKRLKLEEASLG